MWMYKFDVDGTATVSVVSESHKSRRSAFVEVTQDDDEMDGLGRGPG